MYDLLKAPTITLVIVMLSIAVLPSPQDGEPRLEQQADCLWYSARNHGFYDIQHQAVTATTTVTAKSSNSIDVHPLWWRFVKNAGAADCGAVQASPVQLAELLSNRQSQADRVFRTTSPMSPAVETGSVLLARQGKTSAGVAR